MRRLRFWRPSEATSARGLPFLECPGVSGAVDEGDILEMDLKGGVISNIGKGVRLRFSPLPEFIVEVLNEGGLAAYLRRPINEW